MTLEATFSLTPRESYYHEGEQQKALLHVNGAYFLPSYYQGDPYSFDGQHAEDRFYFHSWAGADPTLDYSNWQNRMIAPHIALLYDLSAVGTEKELALIFGFQAVSESRLLIVTNAGLLSDEILAVGDNQFLVGVEGLSKLWLFFIHARQDGSIQGGNWFFKAISGYVI